MKKLLAACAIAAALCAPAVANDSIGGLVPGGGGMPSVHVTSIRERQFHGIVRQHTDFSCGAATIATLFSNAYSAPVQEKDVLKGMYNVADPTLVRERGFSLLDIKNYAKVVGLSAEGFDVPMSALTDLRVPAIVLLDFRGYHHFALLKKFDGTFAYLADPALGNRTVSAPEFNAEWSGTLLVVLGKGYNYDNPLVRVSPPLGSGQLYASAPTAPTPEALSAMIFSGVPGVQRL